MGQYTTLMKQEVCRYEGPVETIAFRLANVEENVGAFISMLDYMRYDFPNPRIASYYSDIQKRFDQHEIKFMTYEDNRFVAGFRVGAQPVPYILLPSYYAGMFEKRPSDAIISAVEPISIAYDYACAAGVPTNRAIHQARIRSEALHAEVTSTFLAEDPDLERRLRKKDVEVVRRFPNGLTDLPSALQPAWLRDS